MSPTQTGVKQHDKNPKIGCGLLCVGRRERASSVVGNCYAMLSVRPMLAVLRKGAWFCRVGYEARAAFGRSNKRRTIIAHAGLPGARAEHKEFDSLAVSKTSFLSKETSSMPPPSTTT